MKFCKSQSDFIQNALPEWAPFCVNYKSAKKVLNQLAPSSQRKPLRAVSPAEMSASSGEVAFFKLLRIEVQKVRCFANNMIQQMEMRFANLRSGMIITSSLLSHLAPEKGSVTTGQQFRKYLWSLQMLACRTVYSDLLLFEQWLILSFTAFSKLLKKHDKRQGVATRESFLSNVVLAGNKAPFSHYLVALRMLEDVEVLQRTIAAELTSMDEFERELGMLRGSSMSATASYAEYAASLYRKCAEAGGHLGNSGTSELKPLWTEEGLQRSRSMAASEKRKRPSSAEEPSGARIQLKKTCVIGAEEERTEGESERKERIETCSSCMGSDEDEK